jgi:hypothetical protein
MFGQTFRLIIRALVIGVLINIGLHYISTAPSALPTETTLQRQIPLTHSAPENSTTSSNQADSNNR